MSNGFTAEEFEPDAVENTASDGTSDTTAKVNGAAMAATPAGGNNAGNASTGETGNTKAGGDAERYRRNTTTGRCSAPPPITVSPARS